MTRYTVGKAARESIQMKRLGFDPLDLRPLLKTLMGPSV
jgi:hypothetical protein